MAYKAIRVAVGHVHEPDEVGLLAAAAGRWKECGLDFHSMVAYSMQGTAYFVGCPKDLDVAKQCAAKYGWDVELGEGIFLEGDDEAGALIPATEKLAAAGINISMLVACGAGGKYGALLSFAKGDTEKACAALGI